MVFRAPVDEDIDSQYLLNIGNHEVVNNDTLQRKAMEYTKDYTPTSDKGTVLGLPNSSSKVFSAVTNSESESITKLLAEFRNHIGKPYVYGAVGPNNFDCSGLTQYCYRTALGIEIGRTTYDQVKSGVNIDASDQSKWKPGDLILTYGSGGSPPSHVVVYTGNGMILEAPQTGDVVKEHKLSPYRKIYAVRRILQ